MERKTQRKSKTEKGKKKEADSPSEGYFAAFFSERNIVMWSVFERKLCCTQLSSYICCNKKGKISKCAKGKKVTLSWKLALVLRQKCTYLNTHIHVCVCVLSLSLTHTHTYPIHDWVSSVLPVEKLYDLMCTRHPWTKKFGGLQSVGLRRVGHDRATKQRTQAQHTHTHTADTVT